MIWDRVVGLSEVAACLRWDVDQDLDKLLGTTTVPTGSTVAQSFVAAGLAESLSDFQRLMKQKTTLLVSATAVGGPKDLVESYPSDKGRWVLQRGKNQARCLRVSFNGQDLCLPSR